MWWLLRPYPRTSRVGRLATPALSIEKHWMPAQPSSYAEVTRSASQAFWRDSALPFVESRRACHSRACYKPHHHPTYSIGAVDAGRSVFIGTADGPVALAPGTLVFVPAMRVHACNPAPDTEWSYQMLHLDAAWLQAVRGEYADAGSMDAEPIHVVTDPTLYARFCALNALLFSGTDPYDREAIDKEANEKAGALIEFVGDCDTRHGLRIEAPDVPSDLARQIQPAVDCLLASPGASVSLDALADLSRMSRYQVIRAFRAVTGMTPHAWHLNQRINIARERIREGDRIAELALHLGFADQAHFQRVFKAHAGVTPGRFRAS
ncbi:AraC-like DNA-binding protein [Cupriavidus plantarum]|uniref:AraC-like DNA-binding protein n=2 Tax=Cupriavidus plantarum TaxID=942865 RepID=A0A316ERJ5_9BURK|nr:AraC-like DNA-binding protein [Cupriavidus plantarum]